MSIVAISLLAVITSATALAVLGWRDPKRLRAQRLATPATASSQLRRGLVACALAPGLLLAITGNWSAFLIWLGAICTMGWLVAQSFAPIAE